MRSKADEIIDRVIGVNGASADNPASTLPPMTERIFNAAALQTMTFPPLKFILPGLVPEGATLVVSRPKFGKSWFVLDIAIATAAGRFTLGTLKPSAGDVLYLALEDGRRRLQRRLTKLSPTFSTTWPPGLEFATEWPRADQGGIANIERWLAKPNASRRLVIVDTLAQFRKISNGKTQIYADDYAAISDLQKLASKYNVGILIVHHDRKSEADDVFDTVSGTLGLTGAADTILIMKRQSGAVTLHICGRDTESDSEIALQFDKSSCRWSILGNAAEVHRSAERQRVLAALDKVSDGLSVSEVVAAAGLSSRNGADKLLFRMVEDGEIERVKRGLYGLPGAREGMASGAAKTLRTKNSGKISQKVRSDEKPATFQQDSNSTNLTMDLTQSDCQSDSQKAKSLNLQGCGERSDFLTDLTASRSEGDLDLPDSLRRCSQCNAPGDDRGAVLPHGNNGKQVWLHAVCVRFWEKGRGKEDAWPWHDR